MPYQPDQAFKEAKKTHGGDLTPLGQDVMAKLLFMDLISGKTSSGKLKYKESVHKQGVCAGLTVTYFNKYKKGDKNIIKWMKKPINQIKVDKAHSKTTKTIADMVSWMMKKNFKQKGMVTKWTAMNPNGFANEVLGKPVQLLKKVRQFRLVALQGEDWGHVAGAIITAKRFLYIDVNEAIVWFEGNSLRKNGHDWLVHVAENYYTDVRRFKCVTLE